MDRLTINGVDLSGDLPGDWTIGELIRVVEGEILLGDELVVSVSADGREHVPSADDDGPRLADIRRVEILARRATELVDDARRAADASLESLVADFEKAAEAFLLGRQSSGWEAYGRGIGTLSHFFDLTQRLTSVIELGTKSRSATAAQLTAVLRDAPSRLGPVDEAAERDDLVEMCDALDETVDWLTGAWSAAWATPAVAVESGR